MCLFALGGGPKTGTLAGRGVIDRQFFGQLDGSRCPAFSRRRTAPLSEGPRRLPGRQEDLRPQPSIPATSRWSASGGSFVTHRLPDLTSVPAASAASRMGNPHIHWSRCATRHHAGFWLFLLPPAKGAFGALCQSFVATGLAGDDATSHHGEMCQRTCPSASISDQDTIGSCTRLAPGPDLWRILWTGHLTRHHEGGLRGVTKVSFSDTALSGSPPERTWIADNGGLDVGRDVAPSAPTLARTA